MFNKSKTTLFILALGLLLVGCQDESSESRARAEIKTKVYDTNGKELGVVTFAAGDEGTLITANFKGLGPSKTHGFHIHENGVCEGDFKTAGGHFNPSGHAHGSPGMESHAGDLGNITADDKGNASFNYVSKQLTVDATSHGIIGKTVVIHMGEDDLESQPSGDAGNRMGCGVISMTGTAFSE